MCRAVTCNKCGKASWAGCGAHVEQVLGHVPNDKRCQCRAQAGSSGGGIASAIRGLFGK